MPSPPPVLLIAEAGWDLPDRGIILAKLRLMDRLLRREHDHRISDEIKSDQGEHRDGPSVVTRQRVRDVILGESKGLCAEVSQFWTEAGMGHKWPTPMHQPGPFKDNDLDMARAATRISRDRHSAAISERSLANPDIPIRNYETVLPGD